MTISYDNLLDDDDDVLDVITHEAGLAAMEDPTSTPAERKWQSELLAKTRERLAEMRRALLPEAKPIRRTKPPRPGLVAMTRDALVALAEQLVAAHGADEVQFAHRDLGTLSDDDLRNLITHLEESSE
jgi:hypothetical protein